MAKFTGAYDTKITETECITQGNQDCIFELNWTHHYLSRRFIIFLHSIIDPGYIIERDLDNLSLNYILLTQEGIIEQRTEELRKTLRERNEILRQLDEELAEAADYVKSALPLPITEGTVRTDWKFIPSTSLGGDSFGCHWLDDDNFAIYLLDVSGHGVGASLLSVAVINVLRSQSLPNIDFRQPDQVLSALNKSFPSEEHNNMFFTIWYGVYNKSSKVLQFSSGGHPPALWLPDTSSTKSKFAELRTKNTVIGNAPDITFKKDIYELSGSGRLIIFSDGVYDIKRSDDRFWTYEEFVDFIAQPVTKRQSGLDRLLQHVQKMKSEKTMNDDFSILEVYFE